MNIICILFCLDSGVYRYIWILIIKNKKPFCGINMGYMLIAKRSVVSAANYAGVAHLPKIKYCSSFSIEVNSPHANEVHIQPIFCQQLISILLRGSHDECGFDTWIWYIFHIIYCVSSQSIVFWWSDLVRRTVMSDIKARCCRCSFWLRSLNGGIS